MHLILADNNDVHADSVVYYLQQANAEVVRFDPNFLFDKYNGDEANLLGTDYIVNVSDGTLKLKNGIILNTNEIQSVYNRSFYIERPDANASTIQELSYYETLSAFKGFCSLFTNAVWINDPWDEERADNKIYQHLCAQKVGLDVPDTLVTNNYDELVKFFNKNNKKVIIKQLSDRSLIDEEPFITEDNNPDVKIYGFYTSTLSENDLISAKEQLQLNAAPSLFQEELIKKSELRITVIGNDIFTYRIYSQENIESKTDFRRVDNLRNEKTDIPQELKEKIQQLMSMLHLKFATLDFVETIDGRTVFLEANVCGNWLWLENLENKSEISKAISDYIIAL